MYSSISPSPTPVYKSLSVAPTEEAPDSLDNYFGVYDLHKAKDPRLVSDKSRIFSNDPQPTKIENDFFVGTAVVMHKTVDESMTSPYEAYLAPKQRRWEFRWQGMFKQRLPPTVQFGAEVDYDLPEFGFATKTVVRIMLSVAIRISGVKGYPLDCNYDGDSTLPVDENGTSQDKFHFLFPMYCADTILCNEPGDPDTPDICQRSDLLGKVPRDHVFSPGKVYTFCYYSMYCDFATWDVRKVLGASGTSLSRIIGPQPVHIVMKDMVTNEYYFDMLIANKCLSPWWESVIQTGYPPVTTYRARSRGSTWGDIAFYSARSHVSDYGTDYLLLASRRRSSALPASEAARHRAVPKARRSPRKLASYIASTTSRAFHYVCLGGCIQGWRRPVPQASRSGRGRGADVPTGGPFLPLA